MINFRIFGVNIRFSFWFFAVVAAFILVGKEAFFWYLLLPVLLHESGHLLALLACGGRVAAVHFTAFGVNIRKAATGHFGYGRDILVASAGICANFAAALACYCLTFQSVRNMFFVASNFAVALFNLLPIGNLDGGELMKLMLERFGGVESAHRIARTVSFFALTPLLAAAIFLLLRGGNFTLLLICLYLSAVVIFQM